MQEKETIPSVVLPITYLGSNFYYSILVNDAYNVYFEKHEHYVKQSYRNRTIISTANGVLNLTVPIVQPHVKTAIQNIRIDYSTPWQKIHWKSIESAYKKSPFFDYYSYIFEPYYEKKIPCLIDLNASLMQEIMKILKINKPIFYTEAYNKHTYSMDGRDFFSKNSKELFHFDLYPNVFSCKKNPYTLSVLDVLFNLGPDSYSYFKKQTLKNDFLACFNRNC